MNILDFYIDRSKTNTSILIRREQVSTDKILFLDRDGVMIHDVGHISSASSVEIIHGLNDLLLTARKKGYSFCVVTNQSSIPRGIINYFEYIEITCAMLKLIPQDLWPSYILASFWHPKFSKTSNNSSWRKPGCGMFEYIERISKINVNKSIMIGDKLSDLIPANKFGIKRLIYLESNHHKNEINKILLWDKEHEANVEFMDSFNIKQSMTEQE